jgi:hypothetical protein
MHTYHMYTLSTLTSCMKIWLLTVAFPLYHRSSAYRGVQNQQAYTVATAKKLPAIDGNYATESVHFYIDVG